MGNVEIAEIGRERGFVLPAARAKQLGLVAIGVGMTAMSAVIILGGNVVLGVVCTAMFGAVTLLALRGLVGQRGLAVTPTRLVFLGPGRVEIPWDDIEHVELFKQGPNTLMGVTVTDPASVLRRRMRWLRAVNRTMVDTDVSFPVNLLAGGPDAALDLVGRYLEHPERRRTIGAEPELANVTS